MIEKMSKPRKIVDTNQKSALQCKARGQYTHNTKTLGANISTALLLALLIGCSQPAEPIKPEAPTPLPTPTEEQRSPLQLFLDLSHIRISLKTMHDQHYLNYFRLETPEPDLHHLLIPQVRNYIIESVHGGTLLDRFVSAFEAKVTEAEINQMNQWLQSPLGKKVTLLEMGKFTDPNFTLKPVKYESLDADRQALITEYVDENNLVSISINVLRLTKIGILKGIQSGQVRPQKVSPPDVTENDLVYARYNLLDYYSTLFQSLSIAELEQIVKISQNSTFKKVTMAINRALVMAFNNTAGNIGRIIAQEMPQIQLLAQQAAKEAAALAAEVAPPENPPVKKRHERFRRPGEQFKTPDTPLPTRQRDFESPPSLY